MPGTIRTYVYNPSVWLLMGMFLFMVEYTTRCGDALR